MNLQINHEPILYPDTSLKDKRSDKLKFPGHNKLITDLMGLPKLSS